MTSGISSQRLKLRVFGSLSRLHPTTLVVLSLVFLFLGVMSAWFLGEPTINEFFTHLHCIQRNPPFWLEAPTDSASVLLLPTVLLATIVLLVIQLSPQQKLWSKVIIVSIVLALLIRYILWRSLSTLNLSEPLNGFFSILLLILEAFTWINAGIQLYFMFRMKDRTQLADQMSKAVLMGEFQPSVDILIPTYSEPEFILKRTIVGCQALDYDNKMVYLLDDKNRPEIKRLAEQLGCKYITRTKNRHAKAGNLNHALSKTQGELIVVFDADFIPTRNFLKRTVGFFQNPQVALVQTPQSFYNPNPIARNLGMEDSLPSDEEVFYEQIEVIKDGVDSAVCSGTSCVFRRSALERIGGFYTKSICEDYFTGIRLSAQGYRLIYLNEKLSAGLAAENMGTYLSQRQRWCRGTLQAFFINSNPLTIPGLNLSQRLVHLEGILSWMGVVAHACFLIMPLLYEFFGIVPVKTTSSGWLYFFLPYFFVQFVAYRWLSEKTRSILVSSVYQIILGFPLALTVIEALTRPFSKGFKVTQKGLSSETSYFNLAIALPLMGVWVLTVLGLLRVLLFGDSLPSLFEGEAFSSSFSTILFWSLYNLFTLSICLFALVDIPKLEPYEWFNLQRVVKLEFPRQTLWGVTSQLSEMGAEIVIAKSHGGIPQHLEDALHLKMPLKLELMDEEIRLNGQVTHVELNSETATIKVQFEAIPLQQYRNLITLLYCRPGQWKPQRTFGEFKMFQLFAKALLKPKFLSTPSGSQNAVKVAQI